MRMRIGLAGVVAAVAWAGSASAQTTYNIIQPSVFQNTTVSRNNLPITGSAAISNTSKLANVFYRGAHMPGNKPTVGTSIWPTPAAMQALTPAYMSAFGVQRPTTAAAKASPWTSWLSALVGFGK
jgi:hypothetical protein